VLQDWARWTTNRHIRRPTANRRQPQEELLRALFDESGLELVALVAGHVRDRPFK
jgi:hypothetical protein